MSILLSKVQAAGYKVSDVKNALGFRIITVHSPYYSTWFRMVINPQKGVAYCRALMENTVRRCLNCIENPVSGKDEYKEVEG